MVDIVEEIKKLLQKAEADLKEAQKGIIVLKEAGEDVTRQEEEYAIIQRKIEGFKAGLKKIS